MAVTTSILTRSDEWALLSHIDDSVHRILFILFLKVGLTVHELVSIRVADINLQDNTLTIQRAYTKGKRRRLIHLEPDLASALFDFIRKGRGNANSFLLSSRQSKGMTERRIQQIVHQETKRILGRPLHPRILRQSFIINAFIERRPLREIEETVGVMSIQPYLYAYFKSKETRT